MKSKKSLIEICFPYVSALCAIPFRNQLSLKGFGYGGLDQAVKVDMDKCRP